MARDVHPEIKRALGASERHSSEANEHASKVDRLLDKAQGKPRAKEPSLAEIDAKLEAMDDRWEEDSKVIRARLAEKDEDTLSMHLPGGAKISAKGAKGIRAALAIAALLAVVAVAWVLGRATAPRHERPAQEAPAAPK